MVVNVKGGVTPARRGHLRVLPLQGEELGLIQAGGGRVHDGHLGLGLLQLLHGVGRTSPPDRSVDGIDGRLFCVTINQPLTCHSPVTPPWPQNSFSNAGYIFTIVCWY